MDQQGMKSKEYGTSGTIPKYAEIVIIGAGVMGASIAYHLCQKGITDVVVFEKEDQVGMGSTSKACGGIRAQFGTEINIRICQTWLSFHDSSKKELATSFSISESTEENWR